MPGLYPEATFPVACRYYLLLTTYYLQRAAVTAHCFAACRRYCVGVGGGHVPCSALGCVTQHLLFLFIWQRAVARRNVCHVLAGIVPILTVSCL